jgi:hypothetical protein
MLVPPALLVALVWTGLHVRRAGARGRHRAAAWIALFHGWTLVIALGAHAAEVLVNWARGRSIVGETPLAYGWRVYSLLLFGAVLIRLGAWNVAAGGRLLRDEPRAGAEVVRTSMVVVAVVLPVAPFDPFLGLLFAGASALTAGVVALAVPPAVARPSAWPAATVGPLVVAE